MTSQATCSACEAGKFSSKLGSSICSQCFPGSFSLAFATSCTVCESGSFSSSNNSERCIGCAAGSYSSQTGSTVCSSCDSTSGSDMLDKNVKITCTSSNADSLCRVSTTCSDVLCNHGIISRTTPGEVYNNNEGMTITIVAPYNYTITLMFTSFMTEPDYDFVKIFSCLESTCDNSTLLNTLSGKSLPATQYSRTGIMKIVWASEACCPKPSSACPCDTPIHGNILTGWTAAFFVSGPNTCHACSTDSNGCSESSESLVKTLKTLDQTRNVFPDVFPEYNTLKQAPNHESSKGRHGFFSTEADFDKKIEEHSPSPAFKLGSSNPLEGFFVKETNQCLRGSKCFPQDFLQDSFKCCDHEVDSTLVSQRFLATGQSETISRSVLTRPLKIREVSHHNLQLTPKVSTFALRQMSQGQENKYSLCDLSNKAAYGDCLASTFESLEISNLPSLDRPSFPGLEFEVVVEKKDLYGQIIITDSSSLLQVLVAKQDSEASSSVLGTTVVPMQNGAALFSFSVKPSFARVSFSENSAELLSKPFVYFSGIDSEALLNQAMRSTFAEVAIANGSDICPIGYILNLDAASRVHGARAGICSRCKPGTYSVSQLKGAISDQEPSCLNCPLGGDCGMGGNNVSFDVGSWIITSGMYTLIGCPIGYQLQNKATGQLVFSHDSQGCLKCESNEYVLDSNNPNYKCNRCPTGAICDGNSLRGRVSGSVWTPENQSGTYSLRYCPKECFFSVDPTCFLIFCTPRSIGRSNPLLGMQGHQFVGSSGEVHVDPGSQQCLPCKAQQYILDSNNPMISCQDCPIGAICDGSALLGRVSGSVWTPENQSGTYVLRYCPKVQESLPFDSVDTSTIAVVFSALREVLGVLIHYLVCRGINLLARQARCTLILVHSNVCRAKPNNI